MSDPRKMYIGNWTQPTKSPSMLEIDKNFDELDKHISNSSRSTNHDTQRIGLHSEILSNFWTENVLGRTKTTLRATPQVPQQSHTPQLDDQLDVDRQLYPPQSV
ncbi:uncharacterized protein CTRU02_212817 [Colletotrichum truncatum]|uniref:Uncharacterized protein n=1 Tax=Colletotrichum truncatum TaxID=5467 RepID=A0ACC3YIX9_COLTU